MCGRYREVLHDTDANLATLQGVSALGVKMALENFGTGYSSLRYLQEFPITSITMSGSRNKDEALASGGGDRDTLD